MHLVATTTSSHNTLTKMDTEAYHCLLTWLLLNKMSYPDQTNEMCSTIVYSKSFFNPYLQMSKGRHKGKIQLSNVTPQAIPWKCLNFSTLPKSLSATSYSSIFGKFSTVLFKCKNWGEKRQAIKMSSENQNKMDRALGWGEGGMGGNTYTKHHRLGHREMKCKKK